MHCHTLDCSLIAHAALSALVSLSLSRYTIYITHIDLAIPPQAARFSILNQRRTFLPPRAKATRPNQNTNLRFPQVVCIISKYLWLPFFFKVRPLALSEHEVQPIVDNPLCWRPERAAAPPHRTFQQSGTLTSASSICKPGRHLQPACH